MFIHDILIYLIIIGVCLILQFVIEIYSSYKKYKKMRVKNEASENHRTSKWKFNFWWTW